MDHQYKILFSRLHVKLLTVVQLRQTLLGLEQEHIISEDFQVMSEELAAQMLLSFQSLFLLNQ